jgi:hypothetical protein
MPIERRFFLHQNPIEYRRSADRVPIETRLPAKPPCCLANTPVRRDVWCHSGTAMERWNGAGYALYLYGQARPVPAPCPYSHLRCSTGDVMHGMPMVVAYRGRVRRRMPVAQQGRMAIPRALQAWLAVDHRLHRVAAVDLSKLKRLPVMLTCADRRMRQDERILAAQAQAGTKKQFVITICLC